MPVTASWTILFFLTVVAHAACLTDWEQIHQTLNIYPLAIDDKDFGRLSEVFMQDAFANYTGPLANLSGLPNISAGLAGSVAKIDSQHLLGTMVIDITGKDRANSTTYAQATMFGKPYYPGSSITLYLCYLDQFAKSRQGWRITNRKLVFQGPGFLGNTSLLGA